MTDAAPTTTTTTIPAGWYPNPQNAAQQRWWDGAQWTDHVSAPAYNTAVPVAHLKAPPGTRVNTVWIWLVLLLPLLRLVPWSPVDLSPMGGAGSGSDPTGLLQAELAVFTQPAYLASLLISLLITAGTIACAALDWRALTRRGVPAPFHWAFAFTAVITVFCVYPIGRAVVTQRRTGRGSGVMIVAIVVQVILIVMVLRNAVFVASFTLT